MRISDWSSDVCSSDLGRAPVQLCIAADKNTRRRSDNRELGLSVVGKRKGSECLPYTNSQIIVENIHAKIIKYGIVVCRLEESRVGKECVSRSRSRWWSIYKKKKYN